MTHSDENLLNLQMQYTIILTIMQELFAVYFAKKQAFFSYFSSSRRSFSSALFSMRDT